MLRATVTQPSCIFGCGISTQDCGDGAQSRSGLEWWDCWSPFAKTEAMGRYSIGAARGLAEHARARPRSWALLSAAVAMSCQVSEEAFVEIPREASSALIAIVSSGAVRELTGHALPTEHLRVQLFADETALVLFYRCALGDIMIPVGPVALDGDRPLPPPMTAWRVRPGAPDSAPDGELPSELRGVKIPGPALPPGCFALESTAVEVSSAGAKERRFVAAAPEPGGQVLAVFDSGEAIEVGELGVTSLPAPTPVTMAGAVVGPSGTPWLLGVDGSVWTRTSTGFALHAMRIPGSPAAYSSRGLGDDFELIIATTDGSVHHVLGDSLRSFPGVSDWSGRRSGSAGAATWIGPHRALVLPIPASSSAPQTRVVFLLEDNALRAIGLPDNGVSVGYNAASGSVAIGTDRGQVLLADAQALDFRTVEGWSLFRPIYVAQPLGGGFMFAGWGGYVQQLQPSAGPGFACGLATQVGAEVIWFVVQMRAGLFLALPKQDFLAPTPQLFRLRASEIVEPACTEGGLP